MKENSDGYKKYLKFVKDKGHISVNASSVFGAWLDQEKKSLSMKDVKDALKDLWPNTDADAKSSLISKAKKIGINEAVDVSSVIKGMQGNFGGDNESQMKGLQLLKGLATSDDPKANAFMKALNTATTKISKDVLGDKAESTVKENIEEAESKTAKCPDCGGKYLVNTGYCVSCKKKVGGKKEDIITVDEDVKIGDMILEKGDTIRVIEDEQDD